MKKIDYLYVAGLHSDQHVPAISHYFSNLGKEYLIVTENYADYFKWKEKGINAFFISGKGSSHPTKLSNHINKKISLENIVETEFRYYSLPKYLLKKKFYRLCSSIEHLMLHFEVDCIIQKPGGEILRRIFFNLPDANNICFGESYFHGYSTLYYDEYKSPVESKNQEVLRDPKRLLDRKLGEGKEVKYVSQLEDIKQNKKDRLVLLLSKKCFSVLFSYFSHRLKLGIFGYMRNRFSRLFFSKNWKSLSAIASKKKIFYFPLNVKAESELYVRNFVFAEQVMICKQIKKLLPENSILLIKEHPGYSKSLGLLDLMTLAMKGIVIADSRIPSSRILKVSSGVIGVSSTVLIEAIQKNIPVLVMGAWPYSKYTVGRSSENSTKKLTSFFSHPEEYAVNVDVFSDKASAYLHEGSAYSDHEEFCNLLSSITYLQGREDFDT